MAYMIKFGKLLVYCYLLKLWELWVIAELMKICVLRAVTSVDGMTAEAFKFTNEFLKIVVMK